MAPVLRGAVPSAARHPAHRRVFDPSPGGVTGEMPAPSGGILGDVTAEPGPVATRRSHAPGSATLSLVDSDSGDELRGVTEPCELFAPAWLAMDPRGDEPC